MITISLCMIVKNEEAVLERCLQSAAPLADEIIVVDTGSTDGTTEIARQFGAQVFLFPWRDDFSAARNFSFDAASMDYCLWLDADDIILPEDLSKLLSMKETLPPDIDMVMLPYHTAFDANGVPTFTCYRERLIRNHAGFRWEGVVHEAIAPRGVVRYGDGAVTHRKTGPGDPDRNLRILEGLRARRPLTPREQFYYARELTYHGRDWEAAAQFADFLRTGGGWAPDSIQAAMDLADCYRRLEQPEQILSSLVLGLCFGAPTPELCCALGQRYLELEQWEAAIYWYEQAMNRPEHLGFTLPDCRNYIPLLQLCVCHDRLGDWRKAAAYNEAACRLRPQSPACAYNRAYFDRIAQQNADRN